MAHTSKLSLVRFFRNVVYVRKLEQLYNVVSSNVVMATILFVLSNEVNSFCLQKRFSKLQYQLTVLKVIKGL